MPRGTFRAGAAKSSAAVSKGNRSARANCWMFSPEDLPPALRYEGKTSLDWFLDGWINGTSLPKLELKA